MDQQAHEQSASHDTDPLESVAELQKRLAYTKKCCRNVEEQLVNLDRRSAEYLERAKRAQTAERASHKRIHELEEDVNVLHQDKKKCLYMLENISDIDDPFCIDTYCDILRRGSLVAKSEAMWREDELRTKILRLEDKVYSLEGDSGRAHKHHIKRLEYKIRSLKEDNGLANDLVADSRMKIEIMNLKDKVTDYLQRVREARLQRDHWIRRYKRFLTRSDGGEGRTSIEDLDNLLNEQTEGPAAIFPLVQHLEPAIQELTRECERLSWNIFQLMMICEICQHNAMAYEAGTVSIYYGWRWPWLRLENTLQGYESDDSMPSLM